MKKDFIWNIIGSAFSAFNSLFFMIIVTRINGIEDAGIFTFAFSTACLFYIIGIYSGRTYQVTDDDSSVNDSDYFYSKIVTCILMVFIALFFCILRGYTLYKNVIIMELVIFKSLEAFSESGYAVMQRENQLYKVGISLFLKAIISLLAFFVLDFFTKNLIISIIGIVVVNLLFILFYDFKNLNLLKFKLEKFNLVKVKNIIKFGFYAFAFAFLTQYVINAPKYSIDSFLTNDLQTIFGIIIMPATIIVLLCQFVIQPFLLKLKESLKDSKKAFLLLTLKLSLVILVIGILAIIVAYFLGIPVLQLLYNIDLKDYLYHLILIIIGAVFYGISVIFSTSLTTMRSTLSQLIIFIIASLFAFCISNILVKNYSILGASYTYMFTMILLLVLYVIAFLFVLKCYGGRKGWKK